MEGAYALKYTCKRDGATCRVFISLHRAAAYEYGRDIAAKRTHDHAWCNLVTVRDTYHAVEPVSGYDRFYGICNNITAWQGVAHADMSHGDPIINTNCVEFERNAASFTNRIFYNLAEFLQMHMARNDINVRVAYCDKRLVEVFFLHACCTKQAAVRSTIKAFFNHI